VTFEDTRTQIRETHFCGRLRSAASANPTPVLSATGSLVLTVGPGNWPTIGSTPSGRIRSWRWLVVPA